MIRNIGGVIETHALDSPGAVSLVPPNEEADEMVGMIGEAIGQAMKKLRL